MEVELGFLAGEEGLERDRNKAEKKDPEASAGSAPGFGCQEENNSCLHHRRPPLYGDLQYVSIKCHTVRLIKWVQGIMRVGLVILITRTVGWG